MVAATDWMGEYKTHNQAFFAFGPKLRSDKNSGFHQNSDKIHSKTQFFETLAGRLLNKGFKNSALIGQKLEKCL